MKASFNKANIKPDRAVPTNVSDRWYNSLSNDHTQLLIVHSSLVAGWYINVTD